MSAPTPHPRPDHVEQAADEPNAEPELTEQQRRDAEQMRQLFPNLASVYFEQYHKYRRAWDAAQVYVGTHPGDEVARYNAFRDLCVALGRRPPQ